MLFSVATTLLLPRAPPSSRCAAPVAMARQQPSTLSPDSPYLALANYNVGTWRGRAQRISPTTAEPLDAEQSYVQVVRAEQRRPEQLVLTSETRLDGEQSRASDTLLTSRSTDVDLDGTFSAEHASLEQATLFGVAADDDALVLEHSVAVSDDERRRCLLVYKPCADEGTDDDDDELELEEALLLVEARQPEEVAADGPWVEPPAAAPGTLLQLLGVWTGDASMRSPRKPAAAAKKPSMSKRQRSGGGGDRPAASGFGAPAAPAAPAKKMGRRAQLGRALFGSGDGDGDGGDDGPVPVRTNVYKSRLAYVWDGDTMVVRKLGVTAFGGDALDSIVSTGKLATTAGAYCDYETVSFDGADPRQPTLLMLPAGCHVLAPLRIAPGGAFSTEFGAVLPAGESFGWKGFVGADGDGDGEELNDEAATAAAQAGQGVSESASARLVRVQRLYDGSRFVSGTTSLSSVE